MNQKAKSSILITGVAGFIGFHVADYFLKQGHSVVGLDNLNNYYDIKLKEDRLSELGIELNFNDDLKAIQSKNKNFKFVKGSIEDLNVWNYLAEHFSFSEVIHLAAQGGVRHSIENPRVYIQSNINGFLEVLEFCRNQKINKLIYASSSSVYGDTSKQPFSETERCDTPISLYAATKRTNELMASTYAHLFNLDSIGLRFFTVYGPWGRPDMAPFLFTSAAVNNTIINVFNNGNQSRDFTYIDDIVHGIYQIWNQKEKIQGSMLCNIGNGAPVNLMDFISELENATGRKISKNLLPAQPGDVTETYADISILQNIFGYQPSISIQQGVCQFYDWYKTYYSVPVSI